MAVEEQVNHPIKLVPTKPDAELAKEYKERAKNALRPILDVLSEAHGDGFTISFALGPDATGKMFIKSLTVHKEFT